MIQCCLCEDWFHEEHLGLDPSEKIPLDEEGEPLYTDVICKSCSAHCSFLSLYPLTILSNKKKSALIPCSSESKSAVEKPKPLQFVDRARLRTGIFPMVHL